MKTCKICGCSFDEENFEGIIFQEYVCTARFSNGEAWYDLASNSRARLKSVVA